VTPNHEQPSRSRAVECDVLAHARVAVPLSSIPDLRRHPGPSVSPTFLKHADEQTVVGLAAVFQAIHEHNLESLDFSSWGVLGAPRFAGRPVMIPSFKRFLAEGAWGMSPHLIPHRSLHSLSGTISQALKIHGPNFGVGGGVSAADEIMVAALSMLERQRLPGVWIVVTALNPEDALDAEGKGPPQKCAKALAMALTPATRGWPGLCLRLEPETETRSPEPLDYFRLFDLFDQVGPQRPGKGATQPLQHWARLTLEWSQTVTGITAHPAHLQVGSGPHSIQATLPKTPAEVQR
jgi:hypothetical protein